MPADSRKVLPKRMGRVPLVLVLIPLAMALLIAGVYIQNRRAYAPVLAEVQRIEARYASLTNYQDEGRILDETHKVIGSVRTTFNRQSGLYAEGHSDESGTFRAWVSPNEVPMINTDTPPSLSHPTWRETPKNPTAVPTHPGHMYLGLQFTYQNAGAMVVPTLLYPEGSDLHTFLSRFTWKIDRSSSGYLWLKSESAEVCVRLADNLIVKVVNVGRGSEVVYDKIDIKSPAVLPKFPPTSSSVSNWTP